MDMPIADPEFNEAIRELPFVAETEGGDLSCWNVDGVGEFATDVELGEMCGRLALQIAKRFEFPLFIAMIMRDIVNGGRFGAVEAGFIAVIACTAKAGSMH